MSSYILHLQLNLKLCFFFIKTAGSKYTQTGMFEVTKAEEEDENSGSPPSSPNPSAVTPAVPSSSKPSALRVTIPSELQGVAYIEVLCQKGTILLRNSII